jgi:hypothetical protein
MVLGRPTDKKDHDYRCEGEGTTVLKVKNQWLVGKIGRGGPLLRVRTTSEQEEDL